MKTIILIAVLFPLFTLAQNGNSNYAEYYLNRIKFNKKDDRSYSYAYDTIGVKENNIKFINVKRSYKGKERSKYQVKFNESGDISEVNREDKNTFYHYNEGDLVQIQTTGKRSSQVNYAYNNSNIELKEIYAKGKLTSRLLVNYDTDNNVELSMFQNGRKLKNTYVMKYAYENDKVRHQEFIKNNRILKQWDFKCKPEGEEKSSKNLTNICKFSEESNDGSYIEYVRRIQEKKERLYKYYYSKDSVMYKSETFKNDTILVASGAYSENEKISTQYTDKGKISYLWKTTYDSEHRPIEQIYASKGKIDKGSKTVTVYNEDGTVKTKQYSYKGKLNSVFTYEYAKY
ncbi:MAG: hypothetical protein MK105_03270 [Crocinitomicaceae bacterium]|nr:hypothetical protein [Crocinitomicaceae bacterium]